MTHVQTHDRALAKLVADIAVKAELPLSLAVHAIERQIIEDTLKLCEGNVSRAADRLRIHRNTLGRKMEAYGL